MILFEIEPEKPSEDGDFLNWLEERDRTIHGCGSRPSGHRWLVEGEPGEEPSLSCQDCPAGGDDLYSDIHDYLAYDETPDRIGDREVRWGHPLPDDAEPYEIPVTVEFEEIRHWTDYGTEYDVEIHVKPRGGEVT